MSEEITPVPRWHGTQAFRSSLEADWSATLDSLRIKWEYEPRLLTLPSGVQYLPDFWLPDVGTWLEIKGHGVPGVEKPKELARQAACRCARQCACEFPGGVLVIIGRPAVRKDGMRFGAVAWDDTLTTTFLGECAHCRRFSWFNVRRSFACRACGTLDPGSLGHLHSGYAGGPEFLRSDRHVWSEVA